MEHKINIEHCPLCKKMPERWVERPRFGSRELCWLSCKEHGILAGGITQNIAIYNWNRQVAIAFFRKGAA